MIESQVRINDVSDRALILALSIIEREKFVSQDESAFAYAELELNSPCGRKIMKIRDFAKLAQVAKVTQGEKVLIIGGASLYSAAVFAYMGCDVTIFDNIECTQSAIRTMKGDIANPSNELPSDFDIIFFDGGVEEVPVIWASKLKEGGRMALFQYNTHVGEAKVFIKSGNALSSHSYFDAKPPKLAEFNRKPEFSF